MKFRSGNFFKDLGDTLIHNDFDLDVALSAKAAGSVTGQTSFEAQSTVGARS
jgi:hypothetical protein